MILVDTSVWIDFFRGAGRARALAGYLEEEQVSIHPWIVGELALGNLGRRRHRILEDLQQLHATDVIAYGELLHFIESRRLYGRGIGWVVAQLLASALISEARFWTFDRPVLKAADRLGISFVTP